MTRSQCCTSGNFLSTIYSAYIFPGLPPNSTPSYRKASNLIKGPNLVPRVLRLFGQRLVARRDSGVLEFYYRRIPAVKQCKPLWGSQSKHLHYFFQILQSLSLCPPLTKKPEDSGYKTGQAYEKSPVHFSL